MQRSIPPGDARYGRVHTNHISLQERVPEG
jgi:hypothetical protein